MTKRFTYSGDGELAEMFDSLGANTYTICNKGLFDGADVVADEIRNATPEDSGDLVKSLYIARFKRGYREVDTVIGFAGYDGRGVPNPLKAAVLESGSSKRGVRGTHFFSRAVRAAKSKAEGIIKTTIEHEIYEITKGAEQ